MAQSNDDTSESERAAKSISGIYIGTACGNPSERATLAAAISQLVDKIGQHVGRPFSYVDIGLRIEIRGGEVKIASINSDQMFKPKGAT